MCQAKFRLLEKGKKAEILYSEQENSAVHIAVNNLMQDMQKVCPCKIVLCSKFDAQTYHENPRIVIATLPASEICDIFPNWTKKHGPEGSGPCFLPVCRAYSLRMPALRSAGRTAFASSTDTTTASTALMRDVTPFVTSCVCTAPRACPSM